MAEIKARSSWLSASGHNHMQSERLHSQAYSQSGMDRQGKVQATRTASLRRRSVAFSPSQLSPTQVEKLSNKSTKRKTKWTWGSLIVMVLLSIGALIGAIILLSGKSNGGKNSPSCPAVPIMDGFNFPDPAVIRTPSGWHLFSTNAKIDGKWVNIQRAVTTNWQNFTFQRGVDALPKLPSWVDASPRVWAPHVVRLDNGTYIMYYAAAWKARPNLHCLSYATAPTITSPFTDTTTHPWICPAHLGGAIDPAGYTDDPRTNRRYLVYKIDGNALGHGGACGNTLPPILPTPLLLQEVSRADATTLLGAPIPLLTNLPADGPYIEAPSLTFYNGMYTLFFSSNCYLGDKYDVQYATAAHITGPYVRRGQLLRSNDSLALQAPGGLDVAVNGDRVVWHAGHRPRAAYVGRLGVRGDGRLEVRVE